MIEQWYAVHKTTGEVFRGAGGVCYDSEKGVLKAIDYMYKYTRQMYFMPSVKPSDDRTYYEIRKVELK